MVNFLGAEITTASFAMYTSSAAVLVQAVTLICFSSFADHGERDSLTISEEKGRRMANSTSNRTVP